MNKLLLIITLELIVQINALAQSNQVIPVLPDVAKINVIGVGTVTAFPNAAQIVIALKFVKPTLREAVNENQTTANAVLAIIKKYVTDTSEIKTSIISTDKSMKYDQSSKKDFFSGFESTQKIIFTLKELHLMQNFTEEILKTKIYAIERISYFHTDAANYVKKAQELAVTDAIETTERLAKSGNMQLGKIIYIQTNNSPSNAVNNTVNSYNFHTFNKGMGGQGVSSSGQLINYVVQVTMFTQIQ